jgi:hypothetical protein
VRTKLYKINCHPNPEQLKIVTDIFNKYKDLIDLDYVYELKDFDGYSSLSSEYYYHYLSLIHSSFNIRSVTCPAILRQSDNDLYDYFIYINNEWSGGGIKIPISFSNRLKKDITNNWKLSNRVYFFIKPGNKKMFANIELTKEE